MKIQDGMEQKKQPIISFLMVGQSNMAGRGNLHEVAEIVNPDCFMLRMGRWQPMREPINPDRAIYGAEFCSGVSLAASFADEFAKGQGRKVGLIPCADGGTRIEQWLPGEVLYDHAVMMAKLAMRSSTFGGILWHQGESNCGEDMAEYERKLLCVLNAFRKELHAEELPIVMGEISESITDRWVRSGEAQAVNRAIHAAAEKLELCDVASAKGLELKKDGIHFSSISAREMGKRYYEIYRKLINARI